MTPTVPTTEARRDLSLSEMLDTLRWIIDAEGAIPAKGSARERRFLDLWEARLRLPAFDSGATREACASAPLDVERLAKALHASHIGCIVVCDEARAYPERSAYMVESGERISRDAHLHDANALVVRLAEGDKR